MQKTRCNSKFTSKNANATWIFWKLRVKNGKIEAQNRRRRAHELWRKSQVPAHRERYDTGAVRRKIGSDQTVGVQVGVGSFPNKRILRNNLCLPACRILMCKRMTLEIWCLFLYLVFLLDNRKIMTLHLYSDIIYVEKR